MENFKLTSIIRDGAGKGVARKLRAAGDVPAILYGHKKDPVSLSVREAEIRGILQKHPESAIVDLAVGGDEPVNAIIRDVQRHPATGRLLHVDFQRIRLDEKVRVEVQVELTGNPTGVKDQGGILEHVVRSVSILCLPRDIPASIGVDVSALEIGDALRIRDLREQNPSIEFVEEPETTVATVIPPALEVTPAAEEAAEGEGEGEPELVKREGEEGEGEGGEEKDES